MPVLRRLRQLRRTFGPHQSRAEIFRGIYNDNQWGDAESVSGFGSRRGRTAAFSDEVVQLLQSWSVRTLLDAPCGDFNWFPTLALTLDRYVGIDIVPELVARNQAAYGSDTRAFRHLDLVTDPLPRADLILCRDCLVHLTLQDSMDALRNFHRSGSTYLLATTFTTTTRNRDCRTGGWRALNLERPPFSLPAPLQLIDEQRLLPGGRWSGKCLGLWDLQGLAVGAGRTMAPTRP